MIQKSTTIRLTAQGKYWGTLRIEAGRLLLDCQRHGQQVQFDLLASVESGAPAVVVYNVVASDEIPPRR